VRHAFSEEIVCEDLGETHQLLDAKSLEIEYHGEKTLLKLGPMEVIKGKVQVQPMYEPVQILSKTLLAYKEAYNKCIITKQRYDELMSQLYPYQGGLNNMEQLASDVKAFESEVDAISARVDKLYDTGKREKAALQELKDKYKELEVAFINQAQSTEAILKYIEREDQYKNGIRELMEVQQSEIDQAKDKSREGLSGARLLLAIRNGDMEEVNDLLNEGVDVNAKDFKGYSALPVAAFNNNMEMVRLLLDKGVDVNGKGYKGCTALFEALINNSNFEMAKLLLDKGADINARTVDGNSVLIHAVSKNKQKTAGFLLGRGANPDLRGNSVSPLTLAVARYNLKIIKRLLDNGADINLRDKEGMTPLLQALATRPSGAGTYKTQRDMVELFIKKGADVNVRSPDGKSPLDYSSSFIRILLDAGAGAGKSTAEMKLFEMGVKPSAPNLLGAINDADTEMVKLLLEAGIDPNSIIQDAYYTPLLWYAVENTYDHLIEKKEETYRILKILLEAGADPDSKRLSFRSKRPMAGTPLMQAAKSGNLRTVKILLEAGADVNAFDNKEETALSLAIDRGHKEVENAIREKK
jgi:ankyrin repeat protein